MVKFILLEQWLGDISRLKEIISTVKKSANKENSYAELKIEDGKLQINTTDNYRLSHAIVENSNIRNINGVLSIAVLEKITKFDIKKLTLDTDGRTILFSSPDVEIITRLLNQKFPDITNFIKNIPSKVVKIERDVILQALTRLESLVDNDNTNLNVSIIDNEIKLLVNNADIGSGVEIINSLEQKHNFSFNINLVFLKDAFESLDGKNVDIRFESEHKPIYILEENNNNIIHIISPIKK
jgi:DNA polymerase III sliding clamp (beta) subunit (PCNA family)